MKLSNYYCRNCIFSNLYLAKSNQKQIVYFGNPFISLQHLQSKFTSQPSSKVTSHFNFGTNSVHLFLFNENFPDFYTLRFLLFVGCVLGFSTTHHTSSSCCLVCVSLGFLSLWRMVYPPTRTVIKLMLTFD